MFMNAPISINLNNFRRHSPILHRSPSPRRHRYDHQNQMHHDGLGFSETVNNVVEIQRHTQHPHLSQFNHRHKIRGAYLYFSIPRSSLLSKKQKRILRFIVECTSDCSCKQFLTRQNNVKKIWCSFERIHWYISIILK